MHAGITALATSMFLAGISARQTVQVFVTGFGLFNSRGASTSGINHYSLGLMPFQSPQNAVGYVDPCAWRRRSLASGWA